MDDVDRADSLIESMVKNGVESAKIASQKIEKGKAGECVSCGQDSERLIKGLCMDCRREFGLL